jgi:aspartate-semialdehyde dehydrogenase
MTFTSEQTRRGLRVAVVGATGAVGREMLDQLARGPWPLAEVRALASERSEGQTLPFRDTTLEVHALREDRLADLDVALFSAGGATSLAMCPVAAAAGALVVDNSSAWRMDPLVPLVVPEVNAHALSSALPSRGGRGIIANPNCSTVQMVLALWPLHQRSGLQRVIVSTYQSVSGAGATGMQELRDGAGPYLAGASEPAPRKFAHPIAFNLIPHIDGFLDNGYTKEEAKMIHETRKIMGLPGLEVSATCVRVPVFRCHSEAVTVDLARPLSAHEARALLAASPGLVVVDDPASGRYPLPREAEGLDETFVGRLREDPDREATLHFWIVSDNLRKGAATNAVQIMDRLLQDGLLS